MVLLLYALQTRMIFPGNESQGRPAATVTPKRGCELIKLTTATGIPIVALYGPALAPDGKPHPNAAAQPTLLYFYGNGDCLATNEYEIDRFRRLGANVLVAEYVGYGMSGGNPSEANCEQTADAAYDYLVKIRGVAPGNIISCGWSLGGAVAIGLASRRPVGGLIVFSTFTSAVDLGKRLMPYVPVSLLLKHRFESLSKMSTLKLPILIGHGRLDPIVPFDMGEALAAAAVRGGNSVDTLWIDEADHNGFYEIGGKRIDEAIKRFLTAHQRSGGPPVKS
jgi:fermentation-respiration switch protein FrsA (DUF1100 family)